MVDETVLAQARKAVDEANFMAAHLLLQPLLEKEEPSALFLASTFSFPHSESEVDFETRSRDYLLRAATAGYPPALYALGVCYDLGDLVEYDPAKAGEFFRQAAEAGHPRAKFCHGRNLYYGSNGFKQDMTDGLRLIREAAGQGVDDAAEFLAELKR